MRYESISRAADLIEEIKTIEYEIVKLERATSLNVSVADTDDVTGGSIGQLIVKQQDQINIILNMFRSRLNAAIAELEAVDATNFSMSTETPANLEFTPGGTNTDVTYNIIHQPATISRIYYSYIIDSIVRYGYVTEGSSDTINIYNLKITYDGDKKFTFDASGITKKVKVGSFSYVYS